MSKIKYGHSTLSGLVDSDSDEDHLDERSGLPTPESGAENKTAGRKGPGRPKAAMPAKVTKAKAPARRTSGRLTSRVKDVAPAKAVAKKALAAKGKREVLADKTNQQYTSDTEEVDEFEQDEDTIMGDELATTVVAVKESKPKRAKKPSVAREKAANTTTAQKEEIIASKAPTVESRATKKSGPVKRQVATEPSPERIVMESQIPEMEIEDTANEEVVEEIISKSAYHGRHARSDSRPRQTSVHRRRAGSASDTERSDPALRRKLGDISKKYESLNAKYQDLREIGLKEAERNFERLKKQSEEKTIGKLVETPSRMPANPGQLPTS